MQLFSKYTLGIDIKDDSAAIVAMRSGAKGFKVIGHDVFALNCHVPINEKLSELGSLLEEFIEKYNIYEPDVLLAIPRKIALIRKITFPLSVKENFRETMRYEIEKYVPFASKDVYFDCIVAEEDKKSNKLDVLLVVTQKKDLEPYLALQTEIGAMSAIETSSTVLAFGMGSETNTPSVLLYREEETLQCNVIQGQKLLYSQLFNLVDDEESTMDMGAAIHSICDDWNVNLPSEKFRYVDDGTGIAASLVGDSAPLPLISPDDLPRVNLLVAYYLAMKGQQQPAVSINLLPDNLRKRPNRFSLYVSVALVTLIVLLAAAVAGNFFFQRNMINRHLNSEMDRLNKEVAGLSHLELEIAAMGNRAAYLESEDRKRTLVLTVMNELSVILPDTVWLDKFHFSSDTVRIDGAANSATDLIEILESSYLFKDVAFLTTVRKGKDDKDRFSIGLTINTNE